MTDELKRAWKQLKDVLDMVPIERARSFNIEAINNGPLVATGLIKNDDIRMDHLTMGDNTETRWTFQNVDVHFLVFSGKVDLHFRLNDNVHIKHLAPKFSLRVPAGIPFMLKTYENGCKALIISIVGEGGC